MIIFIFGVFFTQKKKNWNEGIFFQRKTKPTKMKLYTSVCEPAWSLGWIFFFEAFTPSTVPYGSCLIIMNYSGNFRTLHKVISYLNAHNFPLV